MSLASETVLNLLTDPAHLIVHFGLDAFTGLLLYPIGRRLLRRHDRNAHNNNQGATTST